MAFTLPTQPDLEMIYGASNIAQWADSDNKGSKSTRDARIAWAVQEGYRYIVGRLANRIDIEQLVALPAEVFSLIARRAGIELASAPRGLVDGDPKAAQLNAQALIIETKLDQILAGQLKLLDLPDEAIPINTPGVNNSTAHYEFDALRPRRNEQCIGVPRVVDNTNFYVN
jgi:hypothetical protein